MISLAGLRKDFQTGDQAVAALRGIDLEVGKGEFFVLLGPSGSGKTTLLRSVAGLEKPDAGEIILNGKTVYSSSRRISAPPEEREIGMVFQSYAIWPHLTVAENIGLVLTHGRARLPKNQAAERIRRCLALVQLENFDNRPARLLSGGQQQRVALARALAVNPALLLMDEPLSNLDARLREEVRTNIKKLTGQLGITVLYVTHDQVEAALVAEFFGSINWIRGKMLDGQRVESEIGPLVTETSRRYDGAVVVGIRPEDVKLDDAFNGVENRLDGNVVSSNFLGDQVIAEVKIKDKILVAKVSPEKERLAGNVAVQLPRNRIVVFPEKATGEPVA